MSTATDTKERPILFSGPMVRAILEGRKTQTRRIVKGKGTWAVVDNPDSQRTWPGAEDECGDWQDFECPYGEIGDRLWVRETWSPSTDSLPLAKVPNQDPREQFPQIRLWYAASNDRPTWAETKWHPSIHMPRWASRISVEITGVRVERLNDICEEDAKSEGVEGLSELFEKAKHGHPLTPWSTAFAWLWFQINGRDSWMQNPWVWVVEFQRIGG